jgi:hypothetical protein
MLNGKEGGFPFNIIIKSQFPRIDLWPNRKAQLKNISNE